MTEEEKAKMSPFGRSVFALKESSVSAYPASSQPLYANNQLFFTDVWYATVNNKSDKYMASWLKSGYSATEYFNGIYQYRKGAWRTLN